MDSKKEMLLEDLSKRLEFLEEAIEQYEFCSSVLDLYNKKFLIPEEDCKHNVAGRGRTVKIKRAKGLCRK